MVAIFIYRLLLMGSLKAPSLGYKYQYTLIEHSLYLYSNFSDLYTLIEHSSYLYSNFSDLYTLIEQSSYLYSNFSDLYTLIEHSSYLYSNFRNNGYIKHKRIMGNFKA